MMNMKLNQSIQHGKMMTSNCLGKSENYEFLRPKIIITINRSGLTNMESKLMVTRGGEGRGRGTVGVEE